MRQAQIGSDPPCRPSAVGLRIGQRVASGGRSPWRCLEGRDRAARLGAPVPINRDTTPAWLLPGPLRRLRLLLRQTRDDAADTRQQFIEARAEQNANLARVEARLQEIAGQAHATRDADTEAEQAVG